MFTFTYCFLYCPPINKLFVLTSKKQNGAPLRVFFVPFLFNTHPYSPSVVFYFNLFLSLSLSVTFFFITLSPLLFLSLLFSFSVIFSLSFFPPLSHSLCLYLFIFLCSFSKLELIFNRILETICALAVLQSTLVHSAYSILFSLSL
jgi:hypothetical protein